MDITKFTPHLTKGEDGIYYTVVTDQISYPDDGNETFREIEEKSFWFKHRNEVIAECVRKFKFSGFFLDIGGGNGFVSRRLQQEGIPVVLLEPGRVGARNAVERGIHNVVCSTMENAGFIPGSVGAAGLFDVIEHVEEDMAFLTNIHRSLDKGGVLFVTVPAYNFLWSTEDDAAGHFRRYTTGRLEKNLKSAGFAILYSSYLFSPLPLPIFLYRSLPSKIGLNKKSDNFKKLRNEHQVSKGLAEQIMNKIWKWELAQIKAGKKIPMCSSCIAVARKID